MLDYEEMTAEQIEEIEVRSNEMNCSMEVAAYIIALETKLSRLLDKIDALWEDYLQR